jgi:murein DD-endopeptidase MepM/ murein hydrolase activator NlpD
LPPVNRNPAHRLLARFRGEKPVETAGLRYTRRVRPRSQTEPIAGPTVKRVAGRLAAVPAPLAMAHPIDPAVPPLGRKRSGLLGWKGVVALAICVMIAASVAMASLSISQPGTAASNRTQVPAIGAAPSPSEVPTDNPSPTLLATPPAAATAEPRVGSPISGSAFQAYTVRAGDTLTRIANAFGLSISTLYWANSSNVADPQLVKIGQTLMIPPTDGLAIEVPAGATLKSIADKYGIDAQALSDANDLTDPTLVAGQLLLVPGADTPPLPVIQAPVPAPNWLGKLIWPAVSHYTITQRFGCTGWYGEPRWGRCAHYHDGLDIGGPRGVPVVAAASGTVIYAGWRKRGTDGAAGGIVVWISHGGTLYTTYNHLSAATVKIGQRVTAGQRVGSIGATGAAVGSHLHFEVWITYPWSGGTIAGARDPLLYIKKR